MNKILEEDLKYISEYDLPYDEMKGKTVLITGATGLIGVSLVRALLAIGEIKVIAFVRNEEKAENIYKDFSNKYLNLFIGDIVEKIEIEEDIDYIFHCASITTSKIIVEQPVETIFTSIEGTKNILELSRQKKCKSLVYISSMEVYGVYEKRNDDVTENELGIINPLEIRSSYPESKRLCENMCVAYCTEYDVPVKIARLSQTFGAGILPEDNRIFAQFARSVINGQDIVLHTKGLSEGNYCYTRDCITGLITILLKGASGQAYNVSNPKTHTTILEMARMVSEKIAQKRIKVVFDIPETNVYGYAKDTKLKLNSDKLQSLGWKAEIDLEEAYRRMIEAMK